MDQNKIYPRSNDNQTAYLKSVVTRPTIKVGDFIIYNDFVNAHATSRKTMCATEIADNSLSVALVYSPCDIPMWRECP